MDTSRIISIIISDLSLENLKVQETLERSINSNEHVDSKINDVKSALRALALNELMLTKFQGLITNQNNTQTKNENENG
jgi:hypothetical protein